MTPEDWIAAGAMIDEMTGRGFFFACWSPGEVTDGRYYRQYPNWRVQFQRGAHEAAALIDCEGTGESDTFLEAVRAARIEAGMQLMEWERSYREANGVEPPLKGH